MSCRGHQDANSSDAPYFCRDECQYAEPDAEPTEAVTNTGHPNVLRFPVKLTDGPSILVVSAPNKDIDSAQQFIRSLGAVLACGEQVACVLREGWDVGVIGLSLGEDAGADA